MVLNFILVSQFGIHLLSHADIYSLYHYIKVNFTFALMDCVRSNKNFFKSRFLSMHFTVILAGLKKIVHYTEDFVKSRFQLFWLKERGIRMSSALVFARGFKTHEKF